MLVWRSDVESAVMSTSDSGYVVKPMSKRGDVYLWLCHVVKPMKNGSKSPSKQIE